MKNSSLNFILLGLCWALFSSCGHLFYHPHTKLYTSPDKFQVAFEDIEVKSCDNTMLKGWLLKSNLMPRKGTIVHFHGNAENRSTHFFQTAWLTKQGWDVIVFDYRGYADSQGAPSREGIYHDAHSMLKKAFELHTIRKNPHFVILGQSLGGNIALAAANEFKDKVDLLVLDSTFLSYRQVAFEVLKKNAVTFLFSPLAFVLVNDDYAGNMLYKNLKTPVLILHGESDQVVPLKMGQEISDKLPTAKKLIIFEGMKHLEAFSKEENRLEFAKTLEKLVQGT